jgi:hypothetical protein
MANTRKTCRSLKDLQKLFEDMGAQPEVEDGFVTWSLDSRDFKKGASSQADDETEKD